MAKVAIVTDSTSSMPVDLVKKYNINVVSQVIIWGEKTYEDQIDITSSEFYTRLSTSKTMPTTSQASPNTFVKMFSKLRDAGYQDILCVLISNKLSGTIGSYNQSREMFPDLNIQMVDSLSTAMGLGFQVITAARTVQEGGTMQDAIKMVEQARDRTGIIITPATLEFLHRGGRIGGGARFLGTLLNFKPVLELVNGRLEPVERVRTRRKVFERIGELIKERVGDSQPLHLAALHANALEEAQELLDIAAQGLTVSEKLISEVSPAVGAHTGPGTVGIAWMHGM